MVIKRKRAFPPLFLRSVTEQRKRAKREKRKIIAAKSAKNAVLKICSPHEKAVILHSILKHNEYET